MKFLIVDTYYAAFLRSLYRRYPTLAAQSYDVQKTTLFNQCFGTSNFYSLNLAALGHEAEEVIANCLPLQLRWIVENGVTAGDTVQLLRHRRVLSRVLMAQVLRARPDVLYFQDIGFLQPEELRELRAHVPLLAGQVAAELPPHVDLCAFDVLLSSFPHYVELFRQRGVAAEYFNLGFEPRILPRLPPRTPERDVVFVGGVSSVHSSGLRTLEDIVQQVDVDVFGYGAELLPPLSPVRLHHRGEAWGLEMYRVLANARVALNRHSNLSGRYANNMRLYESTGVGTPLITDAKENLATLFAPDEEVVVYASAAECVDKIRQLVANPSLRARIGAAGQQRTLKDHTYLVRMQQLAQLMEKHLQQHGRTRQPWARAAESLRRSSAKQSGRVARAALRALGKMDTDALAQPLPAAVRTRVGNALRALGVSQPNKEHSTAEAWHAREVAEAQHLAYQPLLAAMHAGRPRQDLRVAVEAVRWTGMKTPRLLEVGCGSGYYSEVLRAAAIPMHYVGADISRAMVTLGAQQYPWIPFVVANGEHLPFAGRSFDIVFNGVSLMHMAEPALAVAEASRVAGSWCIFHTVPLVLEGPGVVYRKMAYGRPCVETIFGEAEFHAMLRGCGLKVEASWESVPYDVAHAVGKPTVTRTFVCSVGAR